MHPLGEHDLSLQELRAADRGLRRDGAATGDLADCIHFPGEVPYDEIHRYYQQAELFVFPSFLETFGFPLLEAMASETPLVASDLPVVREVADDAAFYADPYDAHALAHATEAALYAPGARELLVKRGRARVERFTWERTAHRLLNLFQTVLAEKSAPLPQPVRSFSYPSLTRPAPIHGPTAVARSMRSH